MIFGWSGGFISRSFSLFLGVCLFWSTLPVYDIFDILLENENIIINEVDEGIAVVILDKTKTQEMLENKTYYKLIDTNVI